MLSISEADVPIMNVSYQPYTSGSFRVAHTIQAYPDLKPIIDSRKNVTPSQAKVAAMGRIQKHAVQVR